MGAHAIIVIKNKECLQYYDNKWDSYLFLNCKLPNGANDDVVKDTISNVFIRYRGKRLFKR